MRPKIRATIVCIRKAKVLLVSRDGVRWALPGGRPDKGELLLDAATRELAEETGMKAKSLRFRHQFLGSTTVHHVFEATVSKSAEPRACNEIKLCAWFSPIDLEGMATSPTTKQIVAEALNA